MNPTEQKNHKTAVDQLRNDVTTIIERFVAQVAKDVKKLNENDKANEDKVKLLGDRVEALHQEALEESRLALRAVQAVEQREYHLNIAYEMALRKVLGLTWYERLFLLFFGVSRYFKPVADHFAHLNVSNRVTPPADATYQSQKPR